MDWLKETCAILLRKSEKYFKTDMVYLAKGGFWLTLGQITGSTASVLLALAFAHFSTKEFYGYYAYIISLIAVLGIFTLSGLSLAVTQSVAYGFEGSLREGFKKNLVWSGPFLLASICVIFYYLYHGNTQISLPLLVAIIWLPITSSALLYNAFLNGKKEFKRGAQYGSIYNLVPAIITALSLLFTQSLVFIIFIFFFSECLITLIFYKKTLDLYHPNEEVDPSLLKHGKQLTVVGILGVIAGQIDKIIVFHYLGPVDLAIYVFAVAAPEQLRYILRNVRLLAIPKFAKEPMEKIREQFWTKNIRMGIVLLFAILAYVILSPFLYTLIFPQYESSIIYSQIFSLSLISMVSIFPYALIQAKREHKKLTVLTLIDALSLCGFSILFVPIYGLWGAIIAKIINRILVAISTFFLAGQIKDRLPS